MVLLKNNLLSFIEENYNNQIKELLSSWLRENRVALFKIEKSKRSYSFNITNIKYHAFKASIDEDDVVHADIYLVVFIDFKYKRSESAQVYKFIKKIKLDADIMIGDKITLKPTNISEYQTTKNPKRYDEYLMLKIKKEEYQSYADSLLEYYDIKRDENGVLNVVDLLKNMNVGLEVGCPTYKHNVFGMLVLEDSDLRLFNINEFKWETKRIKADTIVIDAKAVSDNSLGSFNVTLCHECFHFHYHKMAFKLMRFFDKRKLYIECDANGENSNNEIIKWMEIQANAIAPHLIVSDVTLKEKTLQLISKYKFDDWTGEINVDYMESVIRDLAKMYGVTYPSLKRRLASMGLHDAIGALNYIDDGYVENYLVSEETLSPNETYEISKETLICALACDKKMRDVFSEGLFAFIDNHICINSDKYIEQWGRDRLTDYAKKHMDECCIKLTSKNGEKINMLGSCLFRDISKSIYHSFGSNINAMIDFAKNLKENKAKIERINQVRSAILNLDFKGSLKYIMDYQDISQKELARDSGVDQSTISKYLSGKNDCRNRKTLVALCCGLKIETSISDMFFKKCGLALDESGEDGLLRYILTNMLENTPKERNEFLKSYGFKPLTSEDYDKFDYDDLDS